MTMERLSNAIQSATQMLKEHRSWIGGTACVLATAILLLVSINTLRARVHPPIDTVTIRFNNAPTWIGESLRDHLASTAAPWLLGTQVMHDDLQNARAALLNSGCFSSISQIRRVETNVIEIDATFLAPSAKIVDSRGPLLIDRTGLILPEGYRVHTDAHLVTIHDPVYDRPDTVGTYWPGTDVAASLSLLDLLATESWFQQIDAIDLARFEQNHQLVLVTDTGSRIIWGSPPGEEAALEAMPWQKVERLQWLHDRHGRIDQHHDGELDITRTGLITKS
jgi:hypothetical protein